MNGKEEGRTHRAWERNEMREKSAASRSALPTILDTYENEQETGRRTKKEKRMSVREMEGLTLGKWNHELK